MTDVITPFPIESDIKIPWGGDWHKTILLTEDDKTTPKNTTGYSMTMTIRRSHPNGEIFVTLSTANGKIVNTSASGQFVLSLTAAEIAEFDFVSAVYRVVYDDGTGNTVPLMIGNVRVV